MFDVNLSNRINFVETIFKNTEVIMKKIKVGILFNEPMPEMYKAKTMKNTTELGFVPYFEVDNISPVEEYELLTKIIEKNGFNAYHFNVKDDFFELIYNLKTEKPDVIFNFVELFHNDPKLEMNIAGIYELLRIPYTGAPPIALANCQNKVLTKRILAYNKISSPRFMVITEQKSRYTHNLRFPLIVKPAYEDASVGIDYKAVVRSNKELKDRINNILENFKQPALVEEFIEGRELNVAIMGDKHPEVLPISEIDFSEMPDHLENIVSYQAKWDPFHEAYHKTIPICPAELPNDVRKKVEEIALSAFKTMGVRDYSRVDIRLSPDNEIFVLEVNPNPDLTESAGFMRSAEAAGYSYEQALVKILNFAIERGKL